MAGDTSAEGFAIGSRAGAGACGTSGVRVVRCDVARSSAARPSLAFERRVSICEDRERICEFR